MTPIIDPMIFYWIGVCENLGVFMTILTVLSFIGVAIIWIVTGVSIAEGLFDEEEESSLLAKARKGTIILIILGIIFGSIATFTPSKDTLYAMTVANCITEDNIDYITEKGEKGVQFIIEQIDTLLEDNENEEND